MVRTQIQLTEEQAKTLRELAASRGVSMAELIRESVEQMAKARDQEEKWQRAFAVMGRYRSGVSDVSTKHDEYLGEGYL